MQKKTHPFHTINTRILLVLLALFLVVAGIIGVVTTRNIRSLYEVSYTDRLLLSNALMGTLINGGDIEHFVELMKSQSEEFKQRQVDFYHNREELFRLQREGASEAEQDALLARLAAFHAETMALKNDVYWNTLAALKRLKEVSRSTYVYVMADTGLKTEEGETLYTYIFDAEDEGKYSSPDMDGLGTSDIGNEAFTNVFRTKKQTERAEHYVGDFGELYFVCVPLLNENGDVVAVLGTDLSLEDMHQAIRSSTALFNTTIALVFILSVLVMFLLLSRSIARPISSLTKTALLFAEGNLHTTISKSALKQRTEIGTLANAFKSTLDATTLYLNSIPESLFIMNRECDTLFRNEQFIKRFGDLQARAFMLAIFPMNVTEEVEKRLKQEYNTITVWMDGCCYAVMLKEIVLQNMPENSILVIANDITDLMREKENAQAAATAKSNFLSNMSHEMRTPMNAILGMAMIAEASDSIPKIKKCLSTVTASSKQLLGIIDDVLDMSSIEAGKLELQNAPMDLEKTLTRVCGLVMEAVEKKNQTFRVVTSKDLALHYIADESRLAQVLTNLLSNAVKFTPEGGEITLAVENTGQEKHMAILRVSVTDTGIGITSNQIARLFHAFEQADGSLTRKYGGAGLGLAISQSIIEKMGGVIEVESGPDAGTTFSFSVALARTPRQDAVPCHENASGIRLLIAESDGDAGKAIYSVAAQHGMHADMAETAEEAAALLDAAHAANRAYDVIFLRHDLPGTDGIPLLVRRETGVDRNTIVLLTTFLDWHRMEPSARENGLTRYITKPVFPSSVLDAINSVMEASGGGRTES